MSDETSELTEDDERDNLEHHLDFYDPPGAGAPVLVDIPDVATIYLRRGWFSSYFEDGTLESKWQMGRLIALSGNRFGQTDFSPQAFERAGVPFLQIACQNALSALLERPYTDHVDVEERLPEWPEFGVRAF